MSRMENLLIEQGRKSVGLFGPTHLWNLLKMTTLLVYLVLLALESNVLGKSFVTILTIVRFIFLPLDFTSLCFNAYHYLLQVASQSIWCSLLPIARLIHWIIVQIVQLSSMPVWICLTMKFLSDVEALKKKKKWKTMLLTNQKKISSKNAGMALAKWEFLNQMLLAGKLYHLYNYSVQFY